MKRGASGLPLALIFGHNRKKFRLRHGNSFPFSAAIVSRRVNPATQNVRVTVFLLVPLLLLLPPQ
jgi:hypothetical protein